MIPILLNHDQTKQVGFCREDKGALYVEFTKEMRITREMFFDIFGNAGFRVVDAEVDGEDIVIRKAEILAFSFSPV